MKRNFLARYQAGGAGHCSGMFSRNFAEFGFGAENYVNDELNGNNEFKSIFMTGSNQLRDAVSRRKTVPMHPPSRR